MKRIRIGVIGSGPSIEWSVLPSLCGPDALAPLDGGAWWSRRPSPAGVIRYQPAARPEVVALCEVGLSETPHLSPDARVSPRLETLGRSFRVPALYNDPRRMLREVDLDAIFLGESEGLAPIDLIKLIFEAPGAPNGIAAPRWMWLNGPPVREAYQLNAFARVVTGKHPALWVAAPMRRAAAHRAARRLIERDGIGPVTAIQARFPFTLDPARFDAAFAAFDALLSFVPVTEMPREVFASRHDDGATNLILKFEGGASLSALFCAADSWNSALPRFEICGTQGRYLVCEAGRRLWHHVPREGARLWEPPGIAGHISAANINGYAEDIKAFLAMCSESPAPLNAERALDESARALSVLEASLASIARGVPVLVKARGVRLDAPPSEEEVEWLEADARNLTLDLG